MVLIIPVHERTTKVNGAAPEQISKGKGTSPN